MEEKCAKFLAGARKIEQVAWMEVAKNLVKVVRAQPYQLIESWLMRLQRGTPRTGTEETYLELDLDSKLRQVLQATPLSPYYALLLITRRCRVVCFRAFLGWHRKWNAGKVGGRGGG